MSLFVCFQVYVFVSVFACANYKLAANRKRIFSTKMSKWIYFATNVVAD